MVDKKKGIEEKDENSEDITEIDTNKEENNDFDENEMELDPQTLENNKNFEELINEIDSNDDLESDQELNSIPELKYLGSDFLGKLDNKVSAKSLKKEEKRRQRAATERVLDENTAFILYKWLNSGDLTELVGLVSAGKEANVYFGYSKERKPAAIKIYKKDSHSVRWMNRYIKGDPRFNKVGKGTLQVVYTWAKKEFKNLGRLNNHNIKAPFPYKVKNNILLMSYIGDENGTPAPRLKDVDEFQNLNKEISTSIKLIEDMFRKAKLVHGDLSEFNILYHQGTQYLIDVSQAVTILHPDALPFLARDIKNMWTFWNRMEPNPFSMEDLYYNIIK